MRKIFALTNIIPDENGGRSRGIMRRTTIWKNFNYDVEILLCGFQFQKEDHIQKLKQENMLHKDVKVTQWFNDLRKGDFTEDFISQNQYKEVLDLSKYKLRDHPTKPNVKTLYREGFLDKRIEYNTFSGKILRVDELIKGSNQLSSKKYYDSLGNLQRQIIFFPSATLKKKRKREFFYNTDGTIYIDAKYKIDENGEHGVDTITYKNGKYPKFETNSWMNLRTYWLQKKVTKGSTMTLSARKLDEAVINANLDQKNVKHVFWLHNDHNSPLYNDFLNYKKPCEIISLTEEQKIELVETTHFKPQQIKVYKQSYQHAIVTEDYDPKKIVIVSRFDNKQKNLLAAIHGFAKFLETNPGFTLDLWGFGNSEQEIRDLIAELNLEDSIFIKGITDNSADKFAHAAAFLITSTFEGLGKTIIESIACGCPVAAHNFKYGPNSFIQVGKSGYIDSEKTPESFAKTIEQTVALNEKYSRKQIASNVSTFEEVLKDEKKYAKHITSERMIDKVNSIFK